MVTKTQDFDKITQVDIRMINPNLKGSTEKVYTKFFDKKYVINECFKLKFKNIDHHFFIEDIIINIDDDEMQSRYKIICRWIFPYSESNSNGFDSWCSKLLGTEWMLAK